MSSEGNRRAAAGTGLVAILAAAIAGASFVSSKSNGASPGMALATAVAMFRYLAAVFSLRVPQARPADRES